MEQTLRLKQRQRRGRRVEGVKGSQEATGPAGCTPDAGWETKEVTPWQSTHMAVAREDQHRKFQ